MTRKGRELRNKWIYEMSFKISFEDLCRLFNLTPNTIKKILKQEREKRNIIIPNIYLEAFRKGKEKMIDLYMKGGTIKRKPPLEIIRELEHKHKINIEIKDNLYYVFKDKALLFIAHTLSALERNMKIKERIK